MEAVMAQIIDFFAVSPDGLTVRYDGGDAGVVSNCDMFSILQNARTPGSVRHRAEELALAPLGHADDADDAKRVLKITATRKRTVTVRSAQVAA
jgi:hypothetical protein